MIRNKINMIEKKLISIFLVCLLTLGGFMGFMIKYDDQARAATYSTPGTGVNWDMDDLVANSDGNVTFESGIYTVHSDITISENDVLTIDPGTFIKIEKLNSFRIYGTFIAIGTPDNLITFTQDPTGNNWPDIWIDHWSGLKFQSTCNEESTLSYCIIEHASLAIATNSHITITNNNITTRYYGISCYGTPPTISNNTLDCGKQCLYFSSSTSAVVSNCILKTTIDDISCNRIIRSTLVMDNCTIITSANDNFELDKGSFLYLHNSTFETTKIDIRDDSIIYVYWYLKIKVVDTNNYPVPDARVTVFDKNGTEIYNQTTDLEGLTEYINCQQYELQDLNGDGDCIDYNEKIYHTPHKIIALKDTFAKYEDNVQIISDNDLVIQLFGAPSLTKNIPNTYYIHEDLGDGNDLIDLEEYFWDEKDDDALNFEINYEENNTLLEAQVDGRYVDFIQNQENWFGASSFQVKATDSDLLECLSNIFYVTVIPTNDPPIIEDINGKAIINDQIEFILTQNEYFNATMNVLEVDGEQLSFTTNISMPNFNFGRSNGSIVFLPSNDDVGIIYTNITVTDENLTKDIVNITFIVNNVNDRPEVPVIVSPLDGDEFKTTDIIKFNSKCDDKDLYIAGVFEELKISWWSDIGGKIGDGPLLAGIFLTEGQHQITLRVTDQEGLSNTASISINIVKDNSGFSLTSPFCTLLEPNNGETINTLSVDFTWKTNFTKPELITYNVFIDTNPNPQTLIAAKITNLTYCAENLENGKTYYWTVIPYLGNIKGNCTSDIRYFKTDLDYVPKDNDVGKTIIDDSTMAILIIVVIIIIALVLIFIIIMKKKKESVKNSIEQPASIDLYTQPQQYHQQYPQQYPQQVPQQHPLQDPYQPQQQDQYYSPQQPLQQDPRQQYQSQQPLYQPDQPQYPQQYSLNNKKPPPQYY